MSTTPNISEYSGVTAVTSEIRKRGEVVVTISGTETWVRVVKADLLDLLEHRLVGMNITAWRHADHPEVLYVDVVYA